MAEYNNTTLTHDGRSKHYLYNTWRGMLSRCLNPKAKDYPDYGLRGIGVFSVWIDDFYRFADDMGDRPKGMTLDRIDGTKGYYPNNCRWATALVQANNRVRKTNKLGIVGVYFDKNRGRYLIEMEVNGKRIQRKSKDFFEACCIRKSLDNRMMKMC